MKTSETIAAVAAALAKAQGGFHNPARNRSVKVTMKSGGSYTFEYATLDGILAMARAPLAAAELAVIQSVANDVQNNLVTVTTRLVHSSGEWIEHDITARSAPEIQQVGSTITYLRRYGYVSLLGIASEEDDDGNVAAGNQVENAKPEQPKPAKVDAAYIASAEMGLENCHSLAELQAIGAIIREKPDAVRTALAAPYRARFLHLVRAAITDAETLEEVEAVEAVLNEKPPAMRAEVAEFVAAKRKLLETTLEEVGQ